MHALVARSDFYRTVFYLAIVIWILPEWIGGFFQRAEAGADRRDRGSHVVLMASMIAGVGGALAVANVVPQTAIGWRQPILFWIGIGLMLVGIAFRWYSIRVLGRFFTRDVATRAGQVVVEKGPYRFVRHPSYSGALLTLLGLGLALTNWLSLLVILAGTLVGYGYRVHVEERALCEALGQAYRDYMKRTRRFVPYLL